MKIVFICQAVDRDDPILATTIRWIKAFAESKTIQHVNVIALRKGDFSLPDNVTVRSIRGKSQLITLVNFYREILKALHEKTDSFFIYQGGPYPALLLPFKWFLRKPIFQWKAHPHIGCSMRFYARYCNTKVFASTRNAFPLVLPNVKIVGQGIETDQFQMQPLEKTGHLVTVGRISPVKHIDEMIKMLAFCRRKYGKSYRLDIYGPLYGKDMRYKQYLDDLIRELDLDDMVFFHGAVGHEDLSDILNRYRIFLSFSATALDRSAVEAMACGLPVISTNTCVEDVLPQKLKPLLMVPKDAPEGQSRKLVQLLSVDRKNLDKIGKVLRDNVVQNHSLEGLIDKILSEMEPCI